MRLPVALLLLTLVGCAETAVWCGPRDYRPLLVPATASRYATFEAAHRVARGLGRVRLMPDRLSLEAFLDEGVGTREHLVIEVTPEGPVAVALRTEIADSGRWIAPRTTCAGYSHARERAIADQIMGSVVPAAAVRLAP